MMPWSAQREAQITDAELTELRACILQKTGIYISESKSFEWHTKLGPHLATLPADERKNFVARVHSEPDYRQKIINLLTVGESYFYRNHPHFEALEHRILPALIEDNAPTKRLRIWSAGCAAGEEPYSLAMLLDRAFPELKTWHVTICATDINTAFLAKAEQGIYTPWSFRGVPEALRTRYFTPVDAQRYAIASHIRSQVQFEYFNLITHPMRPPRGAQYDLILCRNVLIYFPHDLAVRVTANLENALFPRGFLILGHSESFSAHTALETIYSHATFYYRKPPVSGATASPPRHSHSLIPGILPAMPANDSAPPNKSKDTPLAPTHPPARENTLSLIQLAEEHAIMGELDAAERILDELALRASRPHHRIEFLRAVIADQRDDASASLQHLKQAIFLNKDFTIAHYYQGVIAERENERTTAKRAYRNTISLTGTMPPDAKVDSSSGITALRLHEIAAERLKELDF
ncbi:MAG: protein-glutamate O-methyltransferase CheR [Proteobacteria bacterium]|nr:protein-glutamate O-methyltransferase CheR [Pseudomonadota bacterium]